MVIVAGHVVVDAQQRDDYLSGCVEVVRQARRTPGCLDFSLSADLLEPWPNQRLRTMGIDGRGRGLPRQRSQRRTGCRDPGSHGRRVRRR